MPYGSRALEAPPALPADGPFHTGDDCLTGGPKAAAEGNEILD